MREKKAKKKRISNPLRKRIPKELAGEWKKYLVVSFFLILTIGFVSGMYVANGSMLKAAVDGQTKYKLEDGHFEWSREAADDIAFDFARDDAVIYENFYQNVSEDKDMDGKSEGTIRIFPKTTDVNLACVMDGRLAETKDEIAIDRMHADNAGIVVGDHILAGGQEYEVVGLIAYVNYATLHEKATDLMFDAIKFDVAMVTDDGFARLNDTIHYTYAWKYKDAPKDEKEEKSKSDDFLEKLVEATYIQGNELVDYVPKYSNPAIQFATDDMGSDEAMGGVLLDILIVIIAFIFAITISNTMVREASAIGTLRASGYTRKELVRHYLAMPLIVTLLSAAIGNVLGYTVLKNVVVSMYYNSYSLPRYETIWNGSAFLKTTLIPVILMFVVNLIVIIRMLRHTPLQFLRHDLKKTKRKKAMRLPRWSFLHRFRMRIILQNIPNYCVLFIGILFIMVMLAMAVGMPDTLKYYQDNAKDMMIANYQYVLKSSIGADGNPVETSNPDAEKIDTCSLLKKADNLDEEVTIYGVVPDSNYVKIHDLEKLEENHVYISEPFSKKYGLEVGDTVELEEKYENKKYTFTVAGIYEKCQSIAVMMSRDAYGEVFDRDEDAFSGFISDSKITDIPDKNIATVITERDITKMCDQLNHSMGSYMQYFEVLCILLSAALIYLLTKIIIEKNENAISMTKILGYSNGEIARLYLFSTTIVFFISDALTVILGSMIMAQAWKVIMADYSGWFEFVMNPLGYVKMFVFTAIGYILVMVLDFNRIRKVPMDEALKNIE